MANETFLIAVSQIAVALTGFTGVVAVLGHRNQGTWTPQERLQLRTLVETSLTAMFASLTPFVLVMFALSEPDVWRIANLILGLMHLTNFVAFGIRAKIASPTPSQRVLIVLGVSIIIAHFLAAANIIPWLSLVFILGLLQQLIVATLNFVLLLFPLEPSA